jgi:uncharacterized membrane protein
MLKRRTRFSWVIFVFFFLLAAWVLLQFLGPLVLPAGSVSDLSGVVGISDNTLITRNMGFPWNMVYSSGDQMCHQLAVRSFFLNGNQMPFCARCTAIWLGIALGVGVMLFFSLELTNVFVGVLLACLAPLGIDGLGQLMGLWQSTNFLRVLTGLPVGIICGIAIGVIIDESKGLLDDFKKTKKK